MAGHWLSQYGFGSLLTSFLSTLYVVADMAFLTNGRTFVLKQAQFHKLQKYILIGKSILHDAYDFALERFL